MSDRDWNQRTDGGFDPLTRRSWLKVVCGALPLLGGCTEYPSTAVGNGASTVGFGYGGQQFVAQTSKEVVEQASSATAPISDSTQTPYTRSIPGRIQAENFDKGGEGVAYHDTDGDNQGGSYRTEAVDIQSTSDGGGGGYNVGWIRDDEWLEYSVTVNEGTYDVQVRVASPRSGGKLRISLGETPLGTVTVPNTGGLQQWTTVTLSDIVPPSVGDQLLRVDVLSGDFNLNWIEFVSHGTTSTPTPDEYGDQAYGEYGYGGTIG